MASVTVKFPLPFPSEEREKSTQRPKVQERASIHSTKFFYNETFETVIQTDLVQKDTIQFLTAQAAHLKFSIPKF